MRTFVNAFYMALFVSFGIAGYMGDVIYSQLMENPATTVKLLANGFFVLWLMLACVGYLLFGSGEARIVGISSRSSTPGINHMASGGSRNANAEEVAK
jgi:hypothetical protein